MEDPTPRTRMRDYLTSHGPAHAGEVADACDVPLRDVIRGLADGSLRSVVRPGEVLCGLCGEPAAVNDLCDACREGIARGFAESAPD